jgi:hypothetical protein
MLINSTTFTFVMRSQSNTLSMHVNLCSIMFHHREGTFMPDCSFYPREGMFMLDCSYHVEFLPLTVPSILFISCTASSLDCSSSPGSYHVQLLRLTVPSILFISRTASLDCSFYPIHIMYSWTRSEEGTGFTDAYHWRIWQCLGQPTHQGHRKFEAYHRRNIKR